MMQEMGNPTRGNRIRAFRGPGIWVLGTVLGCLFMILYLPLLFGWRDLVEFSPAEAEAYGAYLGFQLLVGAVGLLCFIPALRGPGFGWRLAVILAGAFAVPAAVAAAWCLILVGRSLRWQQILAAGILFLVGSAAELHLNPGAAAGAGEHLLAGILGGLILTLGIIRGLVERGREERAQLELAQAGLAERLRISRDIHDSLSQRLSLIAIHAGALEYRQDLTPVQLQNAAGTVRKQAEHANNELHEILRALREDEPRGDPGTPVPELIEAARKNGISVQLAPDFPDEEILSRGLSTIAHQALHRTIRETLVNAATHAPGQPVSIAVEFLPGTLQIRVSNPPGRTTSRRRDGGHGLQGVRERAQLAGGRLQVSSAEDFQVSLELPWQEER